MIPDQSQESTFGHYWIPGGILISRGGVVGEELQIPATIEGRTLTSIGHSAFKDARSLRKMVLPHGLLQTLVPLTRDRATGFAYLISQISITNYDD